MTRLYNFAMYTAHSLLEQRKDEIEINEQTTVENFRDVENNKDICHAIFEHMLNEKNYELSNNQMCNAINLFLRCRNHENAV